MVRVSVLGLPPCNPIPHPSVQSFNSSLIGQILTTLPQIVVSTVKQLWISSPRVTALVDILFGVQCATTIVFALWAYPKMEYIGACLIYKLPHDTLYP